MIICVFSKSSLKGNLTHFQLNRTDTRLVIQSSVNLWLVLTFLLSSLLSFVLLFFIVIYQRSKRLEESCWYLPKDFIVSVLAISHESPIKFRNLRTCLDCIARMWMLEMLEIECSSSPLISILIKSIALVILLNFY